MAWWKATLLDVLTLLAASGMIMVFLRNWLARRDELRWPMVPATLTAYKQGPGFKGRSATYLVGHYGGSDKTREFSVVWGASDLSPWRLGENRRWVPPPDVPPLGSTIQIHVDPEHPTRAALESAPSAVTTLHTFTWVAVILFLAAGIGVMVWFL